MESIRPDQDELRAKKSRNRSESGKPATKSGRGSALPPGKQGPGNQPGKKRGPSTGFLSFLLIMTVIAGSTGWYVQAKRIDRLSDKLQQADYWVRQSKLALARFEGDLSETGENLEERGSSLEGRIGGLEKQVKTANSEIRKLWGVANDRNKKAIKSNGEALAGLQNEMSRFQQVAGALKDKQTAESSRLDALATTQKKQSDHLKTMAGTLDGQTGKVANLTENLKSARSSVAGLESRIAALEKRGSEREASVKDRLARLRREQSLAMEDLDARLSRVEKSSGNNGVVRKRLQQVEGAIEAIDAARAQLNARLIRLGQEVDSLRPGG